MKILPSIFHKRREKGSVAIEMAFAMIILLMLLSLLLFWARVFWYHSMSSKAAHDAARFLSRATPSEMQTIGSSRGEAPVAAVARWIAESELAAIEPEMYPFWIEVECGRRNNTGVITYVNCGNSIPEMVRVKMELGFKDEIIPDLLLDYFGMKRYTFTPDVAMRYVGN